MFWKEKLQILNAISLPITPHPTNFDMDKFKKLSKKKQDEYKKNCKEVYEQALINGY